MAEQPAAEFEEVPPPPCVTPLCSRFSDDDATMHRPPAPPPPPMAAAAAPAPPRAPSPPPAPNRPSGGNPPFAVALYDYTADEDNEIGAFACPSIDQTIMPKLAQASTRAIGSATSSRSIQIGGRARRPTAKQVSSRRPTFSSRSDSVMIQVREACPFFAMHIPSRATTKAQSLVCKYRRDKGIALAYSYFSLFSLLVVLEDALSHNDTPIRPHSHKPSHQDLVAQSVPERRRTEKERERERQIKRLRQIRRPR